MLNATSIPASTKPGIGSREVYVRALQDRSIDPVPEYSGSLLRYVDKTATATSPGDVMKALPGKLPADLTVLKPAQAEDKDTIVVAAATGDCVKYFWPRAGMNPPRPTGAIQTCHNHGDGT